MVRTGAISSAMSRSIYRPQALLVLLFFKSFSKASSDSDIRQRWIKLASDFLCVPLGPFMGPCTNAKYPFSQFDKKIPNQKIN